MRIEWVYLAFAMFGVALFRFAKPGIAILIVFLGGWILLPVGHFPAGSTEAEFPYWITGLAVPSDMLLTKAWVAPAVAALGAALFDFRAFRNFRPRWVDGCVAAWCVWPLLQWPFITSASPAPWIASSYIAGSWGLPWLLGRVYFSSPDGRRLLAMGLAGAGLACLPISLVEGVTGPFLYDVFYEIHPFRTDGIERYIGFRPLGFFEDGNQFGIWISICALAAAWLAVTEPAGRARSVWRGVAVVVVVMALAAQSVGGIALACIGAGFMFACKWVRPRVIVLTLVAAMVLGGAVYVSGVVPIMRIGKDTAIGRKVVDVFHGIGRGSFTWRISQDQKLLPDALAHPVVGSATWDWWRAKETRPWSLSMLLFGQFGLVGLGLCFGMLMWPAMRVALRAPRASAWLPHSLPVMLATLVVLTLLDAMMNSFIFFPAIVVAGAIAVAPSTAKS